MEYYNETRPLCLKNDTSGDRLEAGVLQIRYLRNCSQDEAPHNSILGLIASISKSLSSTEKKIQQHRKIRIRENEWAQESLLLFVWKRGVITDYELLEVILRRV